MSEPSRLRQRIERLLRPSVTAFFDQFSISGINFVSIILIARSCPHLEFAAYGLALATWQFLLSFQRSGMVLPMIVAHSNPEFPEVPGKWVWVNLLLVATIAIILAGLRMLFGIHSPESYSTLSLTLSLIITPTMLLYEFNRRLMYTLRNNIDASIGAAIVALFYGVGVLLSAFVTHNVWAAAIGMGGGALLATIYSTARHHGVIGRPDLEGFKQWWALASNTLWHLASFLAFSTYSTALPIVVAAIGSPAAVAAIVATRNLTNPGLTISTAVDSFEKPRAGRAFREGGMRALRAATNRTRRMLLMINTPVMLLLAGFAGPIVRALRGNGHADYVTLVYIWIGVVTFTLVNQPYETALIIQRRTAVLFWAKVAGGVVLLGGAWMFVPRYGALAAVWATLAANIVNLVVNAIRARHNFRVFEAGEQAAALEANGKAATPAPAHG